ncbi:MAG: hypothetical protein EB131_06505, partial [Betaproteobacteria bacterium]|nr:hypothetical protein [Betaproteobacteria bacterium]
VYGGGVDRLKTQSQSPVIEIRLERMAPQHVGLTLQHIGPAVPEGVARPSEGVVLGDAGVRRYGGQADQQQNSAEEG